MNEKLAQVFRVQPGEGRALSLMLGFSFFKGISFVFFEAAASAIFLARYEAELLPTVYIATAVVNILLGFGFTRLEARFSPGLILAGAQLLLAAAPILGYFAIETMSGDLPAVALMVWKDVVWVLGNLVLWGVAGFIFNIRQSKRLLGLVGSGEILAIFLGGLAIPTLVQYLATPLLLWISSGGTVAAFFFFVLIVRSHSGEFRGVQGMEAEDSRVNLRGLFGDRYIVLFFALSMISMIAFSFVDFIFFTEVERAFPSEERLARFFGYYLATLGIFNLVSNGFISGRLLNRFGVAVGLLLLPLVLALGDISMLWLPATLAAGVMLWLVVGTKVADEVLRVSIEAPAFRILYQPLPGAHRLPVQTIRESIVEPLAMGLSGLLILAFTGLIGFHLPTLLVFLLLLIVVWLVLARGLGVSYSRRLVQAVSGRGLSGQTLTFEDASMEKILLEALHSKEPTQVIYALRMLAESGYEDLPGRLVDLLDHPDPRVQFQALQSLENDPAALRDEEADEALRRVRLLIAGSGTFPSVRAQALRTSCALGETEVLEEIAPFIYRRNPDLKKNAIAGLLRYGGIDGVLLAGTEFLKLLESRSAGRRLVAASILEEAAIPGFYRPLLKLLADPDEEVRHHAIRAAGVLKNPKCIDALMESLWDPRLAGPAEAALASFGPVMVPRIETAFADPMRYGRRFTEKKGAGSRRRSRLPDRRWNPEGGLHDFRIRLLRLLGRIGGQEGTTALTSRLELPDVALQGEVFAALAAVRFQIDTRSRAGSQSNLRASENRSRVEAAIRGQLSHALRILESLRELRRLDHGQPLLQALQTEVDRCRSRVFHLLSFLFDSGTVLQASVRYRQARAARRAVALEALDSLLDHATRSLVFPLLEELSPTERLGQLRKNLNESASRELERRGETGGHGHLKGLNKVLLIPFAGLLPWTRACAVFAAGHSKDQVFDEAIRFNLDHPAGIVRETAIWALRQVNPRDFARRKSELLRYSSPVLKNLLKGARRRSRGQGMLLTLEKALILKSVPIFEQVPEEPLAALAGIVKEEEVKKGRTFIRKGEIGTSLFVVVEGSVSVHDGGREIAVIGKGEVVGELSALDPEPRAASVTALEDTLLFRIDDEEIYDFMTDNREVARGIIRVLVRRQRELVGRQHRDL